MTEIAFHFNVPDKLEYSCRLLRKAYVSGAQVLVIGEEDQLSRLDELLWTFSTTEFVPHSRLENNPISIAKALPVPPVLLMRTAAGCPFQNVLVNLGQSVPLEFERFERFIEIVTGEQGERAAARQRWKHYVDRGYALKRHDHAGTPELP